MQTIPFASLARVLTALVLALAATCAPSLAASKGRTAEARMDPRPVITQTFFQPLIEHASWPDARFDELFSSLKRLGVGEVILQWTVVGGDFLFAHNAPKEAASASPVLEKILPAARRAGLGVRVGLVHDTEWWKRVTLEAGVTEVHLRLLRKRHLAVAAALKPLLDQSGCVTGFYLPEEIDDVNWVAPARRALLAEHLKLTRADLAALAPEYPLAIAGFANGFSDPQGFTAMWSELLDASGIPLLYFQDGIGVKKQDLDTLPLYDAAARAAAGARARMIPVVELFTQTAGHGLDQGGFKAVPAPLGRVLAQLRLAAAYGQGQIAAFALPEYASPVSADPSLYAGYSRYVEIGDDGREKVPAKRRK